MNHLEQELQRLKGEILAMLKLVFLQLKRSRDALLHHDKEVAQEVVVYEKQVNTRELNIDRDCENILALLHPVAVDLRFILAALKMNYTLERIGDYAEGIARVALHLEKPYRKELLTQIRLQEMFDRCLEMLGTITQAFEKEDTALAYKIFPQDGLLDELHHAAVGIVAGSVQKHPDETVDLLYILSVFRKLERTGDLMKNFAEEIIFHIEAKQMKHQESAPDDL